jgi:probable HAF family extracellular repeat protein
MKSRILTCIIAITIFGALAVPVRLAAQEHKQDLPRYTVIDLGTLGGTYSNAYGISNTGWVSGISTLPGDTETRAFLWRDGVMIDLGTLGGPNSVAVDPPNNRGDVGIAAETSTPDPLGEDYLGFGTHLICLPVLRRNDVMITLPTLGGNNGYAQGLNNRDDVPGGAENTTRDPTCIPPQVLQSKPVIWTGGHVHELPTFPGDTIGAAHDLNDNGQATGWSGNCPMTLFHALLWENGRAVYLGNLGGTINTQGLGINNRGQVAGFGDLAENTTFHAFLWQKGVMTDLGTLPGDVASGADGLNNETQVVGGSWNASGNGRAFIWQDGVMTDLNTLIPPNSPLYLLEAQGMINDSGQIAGYAWVYSTDEVHAFLATPTTERWPIRESSKVVLPENVRNLLQQHRRFGRPGGGFMGPQ